MKELKDYLHLYLGCEVWDSYNEKKGVLFGVDLNTSGFDNVKVLHKVVWDLSFHYVKPILRPLSDMTEGEREIFGWQDKIEFDYLTEGPQVLKNYYYGWQFIELLRFRFDLFGLIEAGLAVNAAELENVNK